MRLKNGSFVISIAEISNSSSYVSKSRKDTKKRKSHLEESFFSSSDSEGDTEDSLEDEERGNKVKQILESNPPSSTVLGS